MSDRQPEPWLRGTHTNVEPVCRAVLHALELAEEDVVRWTSDLAKEALEVQPHGLPSVAFQMRHIARSMDRLRTYASGQALSEEQLDALCQETLPGGSVEELRDQIVAAIRRVRIFLLPLDASELSAPRTVGRALLPATLGGLVIHIAEHTQRHVGQLITTVKVITALQEAQGGSSLIASIKRLHSPGTAQMPWYDQAMNESVQAKAGDAFREAATIMARLRGPGGCPWDREQTLDSIKPHTLEETYEVFDAIDRRAWDDLRDELGDLLLQVLFYAQIAEEDGRFNLDDVVRGLSAKLVRRHPHIFGAGVAETAVDVIRTWEAVKQQERAGKPAIGEGLLGDVPRFVPALTEARKLGAKAAKVGFDWPDTQGLLDKVQEEIAEVRQEMTETPDIELLEEEIGDLYFVLTNLSRYLKVDPEQALCKANAKFRRRFRAMESMAGDEFAALSLEEKDALWNRAKLAEKSL